MNEKTNTNTQNTPTQSSIESPKSSASLSVENKEPKKKRGCLWWIILILMVILILGVFTTRRQNVQAPANEQETTSSSSIPTSSTSSESQTDTPTTPDTTTRDTDLTQTFRSAFGGYRISYPEGWVVDDAAVAVVGVAFKEEDAAFTNTVEVYAINNRDDVSLEQAKQNYVGGALLLESSKLIDFRVASEQKTTFQGVEAYQVIITYSDADTGTSAKGKMIVWQDGGKNYALFAKGPEATFPQYEATFDAMIDSYDSL